MKLEEFAGKTVLVTGHTGFKGSWLCLWLQQLGANVVGLSLDPPSDPSLFTLARVAEGMTSLRGDVTDLDAVLKAFAEHQPSVVIHLAAQALVRPSYEDPVETYATNVMGTVHVLEACRRQDSVRSAVVVTSDKCYENREWLWPYRESEAMGGHDPYSSSKGCSELVVSAYRRSFLQKGGHDAHFVATASARAGNVVGGGDWGKDRLVPDIMNSFAAGEPVIIRNPLAVRPWQFVLEPLRGYMQLALALLDGTEDFAEGWNFGPSQADARSVGWIADTLARCWGEGARWKHQEGVHPHEAHLLRLDASKAAARLRWQPAIDLETTLEWTTQWYKEQGRGAMARDLCLGQIEQYQQLVEKVR